MDKGYYFQISRGSSIPKKQSIAGLMSHVNTQHRNENSVHPTSKYWGQLSSMFKDYIPSFGLRNCDKFIAVYMTQVTGLFSPPLNRMKGGIKVICLIKAIQRAPIKICQESVAACLDSLFARMRFGSAATKRPEWLIHNRNAPYSRSHWDGVGRRRSHRRPHRWV